MPESRNKKGRSIRIRIETSMLHTSIIAHSWYKKGRSIRIRIETYIMDIIQDGKYE